MEITNHNHSIDVEKLKFQILQRRTMRDRFKFPLSKEETYHYLLAALQAEVAFRHREFIMNDEVENQLNQLATWLSSDTSEFGVLLCGGCGNGKSSIMKAFQQLLNAMQIPNNYTKKPWGMRIVDAMYITDLCKNNYKEYLNLSKVEMLGIDDLGIEPYEIVDYGNKFYPVVDLLSKRYEEQLFTFVTTNMTPGQIRERYHDRIADRLNEMMKIIVYKNPTFRKPQ